MWPIRCKTRNTWAAFIPLSVITAAAPPPSAAYIKCWTWLPVCFTCSPTAWARMSIYSAFRIKVTPCDVVGSANAIAHLKRMKERSRVHSGSLRKEGKGLPRKCN